MANLPRRAAGVAERQTRYVQGVVGDSPWEFESPLRHQRTVAGETSVTDVDFAVLPHLRGFPDALERYANAIKHAHPRGKSVVAMMIQRPGADRFLRRVALAVHSGERILTTVEAAEALGMATSELLRRLDAGELPPPVFRDGRKVIWRAEQLTASAGEAGGG